MRRRRFSLRSRLPILRILFFSCIILRSIPGISSKAVTLGSIQIFNSHEWLAPKPTVYFYCQGENKTLLPDVKEKHFLYTFQGEESWQPLTELPDKKCKRCGLYEMDSIKSDDVYDEWELCLGDFVDGKYVRYKEKEFNATFTCPECTPAIDISSNPNVGPSEKKTNVVLVILISILASMLAAIGTVGMYKYWKKRKREQDQARFLKLFDEGDDIEDELDNF